MTDTPTIRLLPGRHRRARGGHPWIFSNEIDMTAEAKALPSGAAVAFADANGGPLGTGFFNPHSLIAGRLMCRDGGAIDRALIEARIARALSLRERLFDGPWYRLVHAEADAMPGLIVDRYGDVLVVQPNAAGMDRLLDGIVAALEAVVRPATILIRGDGAARTLEGLDDISRRVGAEPATPQRVVEGGVTFLADLGTGQKTGWFYDQAANRALVAGLAAGARVLDLYCYLGGFALRAAVAGADSVTGIDRSQPALGLAEQAAALNGLVARCEFRRASAFDEMERLAAGGEAFDIVIADPPAFVKSRRDIKAGARGYRKMVRLAAPLVAPRGLLFAASCSHHVDAALFTEQVGRGLADAGREGRILFAGGAGPDHPVHPCLPESAYLKFRLLQLD